MPRYNELTAAFRASLLAALRVEYAAIQEKGLQLDMSRGKPGADQLDLSDEILQNLSPGQLTAENGADCRNYAPLDGIPEAKRLMGELMGVDPAWVFAAGNSSLALMHDCVTFATLHGLPCCKPWGRQEEVKFLCPVPGYDRHFAVTEHLGFTLIPVPMTATGPDMEEVERLVTDPAVKGIWCIPKYSNPQGITYSEETVRRFAALSPAAADFRIFWDNAYAVHDLDPEAPDILLNLAEELHKTGKEDMAFFFASTSKITYAGGGLAAVAMSPANRAWYISHKTYQTIGYDKISQLRHARMFPDMASVTAHMAKHAAILRPKFRAVLDTLAPLKEEGIASWQMPHGGYFISLDVLPGCAGRVVQLCKEAGVTLTGAGATHPYGRDPRDENIRIAPTLPPIPELETAMSLLCLCVRMAALEKMA